MFKHIFDELYRKNPGIRCIGVWGRDGLELEKEIYHPGEFNFELFGAEIADIFSKISAIADVECHAEFHTAGFHTLVFSLTPQYFLLVHCRPEVLPGRVKFHVGLLQKRLKEYL